MIILTEKPSVAEDIGKALKFIQDKTKGIWVSGSGKDCIISARGHLLESFLPDDYDPKWKDWRGTISELPIIPATVKYKVKESTSKVLNQIKYCFQNYDSSEFILATDAEREGEVIGAEILQFVKFSNYSTAKRFWVSEALTPEVVKKGLADAKPLLNYESYKDAGFARSEADWLIGMNFSRILTVQTNTTLSFGRVQTAILGAIYLRNRSIEQFIPQDYYQLICTLTKDHVQFNVIYTKNETNRFDNTAALENIRKNLKNSLLIKKVSKENKVENVPQLFNITGLQKYCSNKYHLTPDETLTIAQELYEKYKCLSYPRTPSTVLGDDNVDLFKEKFKLLSKANPGLASKCNITKITSDNKRLFNSKNLTDHHALIPLNVLPANVSDNHRNVYNAVLLRFFQTIMEPCRYEVITVEASQDDNIFIGTGRCYIDKGWKENLEENDTEEKIEEFPGNITEGEILPVASSEIVAKKTQPKKQFTNATLLSLMENPRNEDMEKNGKLAGLGTPATRAGIIKELIERRYIQQKGQQLLITELGKFLIETVISIPGLKNFISLNTTTQWEEKLTTEPKVFLEDIKKFVRTEIPEIKINRKWTGDSVGNCPLCHKGYVNEGLKTFYCTLHKNGCSFAISKNICGATITKADIQLLITGKTTKPKNMKSQKTGNPFTAKLKYTNGNLEFLRY